MPGWRPIAGGGICREGSARRQGSASRYSVIACVSGPSRRGEFTDQGMPLGQAAIGANVVDRLGSDAAAEPEGRAGFGGGCVGRRRVPSRKARADNRSGRAASAITRPTSAAHERSRSASKCADRRYLAGGVLTLITGDLVRGVDRTCVAL